MVQEFWRKLNANERMVATGAIIVFIVGLLGGSLLSVVGAAVVLVIYWLKYSPNQQINWPAPPELVNLGISAILALLAVFGILGFLGLGGLGMGLGLGFGFFGGLFIVALLFVIANLVGAGMMALGAWREYQAMPKTTPPAPPPSSPPAA